MTSVPTAPVSAFSSQRKAPSNRLTAEESMGGRFFSFRNALRLPTLIAVGSSSASAVQHVQPVLPWLTPHNNLAVTGDDLAILFLAVTGGHLAFTERQI